MKEWALQAPFVCLSLNPNAELFNLDLDNTSENTVALTESDLVRLRAPLMRLQDHLMAVGIMQEDMQRLNDRISKYLSEVTNEQQRIASTIEQLT